MIDQHFWTSLNVVRELAPRMVEAGFGRIAAVSSPMAAAPDAGMSAYGVGKAAQETLFAALAQEVAGTGVTVNVVRVRAIDTSAGEGGSDKPEATTPAEISAAIRYLFSDLGPGRQRRAHRAAQRHLSRPSRLASRSPSATQVKGQVCP